MNYSLAVASTAEGHYSRNGSLIVKTLTNYHDEEEILFLLYGSANLLDPDINDLVKNENMDLKEGEFDRLMEANGANTNASTWVDWTNYYEVLPSDEEKVELVIRLEAERMSNMILNEKQI